MMCFLGPDGLPGVITAAADGVATPLVGVAAPEILGDGTMPLLLVVPGTVEDEEEIPATLLTESPGATAPTEDTDAMPTLEAALLLSSFLDP